MRIVRQANSRRLPWRSCRLARLYRPPVRRSTPGRSMNFLTDMAAPPGHNLSGTVIANKTVCIVDGRGIQKNAVKIPLASPSSDAALGEGGALTRGAL